MKKTLIILITILSFFSCSTQEERSGIECNELQTLGEVNTLMGKCNENLLNTTSEIENNLIGEWSLSGIISGWGGKFEPISECLVLSINDESLLLKNQVTEEEFTSSWSLVHYEVNSQKVFFLQPNDQKLRYLVGMQFFSDNIMYGAGNADDTDIYVYERLS